MTATVNFFIKHLLFKVICINGLLERDNVFFLCNFQSWSHFKQLLERFLQGALSCGNFNTCFA